jgi:hypothetical protein
MAAKKKKAETPASSSVLTPLLIGSTPASGQGMSLYVNVYSAQPTPSQDQATTESCNRASMTPGLRAITPFQSSVLPPAPSSPIPAAYDEDCRLSAFITSRISARPSRQAAFQRALSLLSDASVGFSDLAVLSDAEWTYIGVDVGIKMDLLKHDKRWHL